MQMTKALRASALAGFTILAAHVAAQGTPQTPPPAPAGGAQQTPAPPGGGRGQGRGRGFATFPAQQRPPGDPEVIARGKGLYTINCSACHGSDLRGGGMGGPNLLRSQIVLNDQAGELILPIVHGSRAERGMPPLPLSDIDAQAIAEYIHSVVATARGQGAPPESEAPLPNALVGNASAGQTYFAAKCSSCHSPADDLKGIGSRLLEAKMLQNYWVMGGGGGGGRGGSGGRPVTVTVTLPSGERVEGPLVRIDDFLVTLSQADGTTRSFIRDGDRPAVVINDPQAPHKALLTSLADKDMHDVTAYLATLK
jgi:cytochrome c oxidase cbb3-type subunit III